MLSRSMIGLLIVLGCASGFADSASAGPWCRHRREPVAPAPVTAPAPDLGGGGGLDPDLGGGLDGTPGGGLDEGPDGGLDADTSSLGRAIRRASPLVRRLIPVLLALVEDEVHLDDAKRVLELIRALLERETRGQLSEPAAEIASLDGEFDRIADGVEVQIQQTAARLGVDLP